MKFKFINSFILLNCIITLQVNAQFQSGTQVLQTKNGSGFFGWAISELKDINGDSITDYIVGSIGTNTATVYSGANGQLIYTLSSPSSNFGYSVADSGDVDGDGINDIIVGGPTNSSSKGVSVVYSGATGTVIWTLEGENNGDRFGSAVSSAGDVNSDGRSDLLIGAESNNQNGVNSGRSYVYSGKSGQLIRILEGESAADRFGGGVALLGDIDSDGIEDHIIGAYGAGDGGGKAYVYSGLNGEQLFELNPDSGSSVFGQFFVANAGDINNDDVDDIYVGDFAHAAGTGRAYVFSGANQEVLYRFSGNAGEGAGPGRSAGDVNNDGFDDIIVGFYTAGTSQAGITRIYSGQDGSILQSFDHTIANSQLGFDAVGIGDVNNDQKYDYLVSAANASIVYVLAGEVIRAADININSGMNGAWFNPATSGQGIMIEVLPNSGSMFVAFFTFEQDGSSSNKVGDPNHRWVSAFGTIQGNTASLNVTLTSGGVFDAPKPVTNQNYGTMKIIFESCEKALLEYSFPTESISGGFPLTRIAADNVALCENLASQVN